MKENTLKNISAHSSANQAEKLRGNKLCEPPFQGVLEPLYICFYYRKVSAVQNSFNARITLGNYRRLNYTRMCASQNFSKVFKRYNYLENNYL